MFLSRTIDDVLSNIEANTEIIVILDGQEEKLSIQDNPRVSLVYLPESIGQRAAINRAAKMSKAEFIMKLDAHCSVDHGFDVKLMADCEYDWTVIPTMKNLHCFNWLCKQCGDEKYQGPTPKKCDKCQNTTDFERKMIWQPRRGTANSFMRFDSNLHFQYWGEYKQRPEAQGDIVECMSLIGACWMLHRDRYWDIDGLDEGHGSWGQMGTEISCKSWLSGGKLMVNKKTWFAHMFRTQGGDFGFPYSITGREVDKARKYSNDIWKNNKWPKATRPFSWLIRKFAPIPGWEEGEIVKLEKYGPIKENPSKEEITPSLTAKKLTKGMVYYTDNKCNPIIANAVREQLLKISKSKEIKIVSVSLEPLDFGQNIVLPLERGSVAMTKQIHAGIEAIDTDIVFLVEHDIIYHPQHFDFTPPLDDVFWYNENTWKVRSSDGQAVFFHTKQTSGCCAYRRLLLPHYVKRVERVEKEGKVPREMGYEPGCHHLPGGVDDYKAKDWMAPHPNVDIRHETNLTWSRFKPEQYRSQRSIIGWTLADEIPYWGKTKGRFWDFLKDVKNK
jgi:glycosyltransferase involved in cell wall biosynthesis